MRTTPMSSTAASMDTPRLLFTLIALMLLAIHTRQRRRRRANDGEVYTHMDHLVFNTRPPTTAWLNMGWWHSHHTHFVDACEELARRLHAAVTLPPTPRILDVGCGPGDSLLLLHSTFHPAILHGVTSLPSHAALARRRLQHAVAHASGHAHEDGSYDVACADAVLWIQRQRQRPSSPSSSSSSSTTTIDDGPDVGGYDAIYALDCAYHFRSRTVFFQHAWRVLRPGGALALVDLALAYPYPDPDPSQEKDTEGSYHLAFTPSKTLAAPTRPPMRWARTKHALTSAAASTPTSHFVPIETYAAQLGAVISSPSPSSSSSSETGPKPTIRIQDISEHVFPGFAHFLTSLGGPTSTEAAWKAPAPAPAKQLPLLMRLGLNAVGTHVVSQWAQGGEEGMLRCILVSVHKPRE